MVNSGFDAIMYQLSVIEETLEEMSLKILCLDERLENLEENLEEKKKNAITQKKKKSDMINL